VVWYREGITRIAELCKSRDARGKSKEVPSSKELPRLFVWSRKEGSASRNLRDEKTNKDDARTCLVSTGKIIRVFRTRFVQKRPISEKSPIE